MTVILKDIIKICGNVILGISLPYKSGSWQGIPTSMQSLWKNELSQQKKRSELTQEHERPLSHLFLLSGCVFLRRIPKGFPSPTQGLFDACFSRFPDFRPAHSPLGSGSGHVIRLFTALCQCTHDRASPTLTKCVTRPAATVQCVLEKRPGRFSWDRVHKHTGVHTCSHAPNSPRYTPFSTKRVRSERVQVTSPIHGCKLTFKGLRRA